MDVAVSCSGTYIPDGSTYEIACGNGQILNAATGVCSYVNNSPNASASFTSTCTIKTPSNELKTSTACTKTI